MQIIGNAGDDEYILKATKSELRKILGNNMCNLFIGQTLDVHKIFNRLFALKDAEIAVKKHVEQLRALANLLELLSLEEILKDSVEKGDGA